MKLRSLLVITAGAMSVFAAGTAYAGVAVGINIPLAPAPVAVVPAVPVAPAYVVAPPPPVAYIAAPVVARPVVVVPPPAVVVRGAYYAPSVRAAFVVH
ncbi:hypothetical protein GWC77_24005 [Paraburkholderia sp. NMBU_R16]|uniref:hypothetical protein n=1 Tax=Paraburkholderia sp. NMBU_R16 TaxID=2698676 RepID=UPI0015662732|nr:hypothetical protein [Paraburkholderia sp. NMBU_R16]NRO98974.1 hypothetical protein [Paraburkholderia sp. NMBU_R16]